MQIMSGKSYKTACLANQINLGSKGNWLGCQGADYKKLQGIVRKLNRQNKPNVKQLTTKLDQTIKQLEEITLERDEFKEMVSNPVTCKSCHMYIELSIT